MNSAGGNAPQVSALDDGLQVADMPREKMPAAGYASPGSTYAQTTATSNMSAYAASARPNTMSPTMAHPAPVYVSGSGSGAGAGAYARSAGDERRRTVPWGMSPWLFAALAALLGMLISGAIVGGVLGSMVANQSQSQGALAGNSSSSASMPDSASTTLSDPATPTTVARTVTSSAPTSTAPLNNYRVAAPASVDQLVMDCPGIDGQTVTRYDSARFSIECGIDSGGQGREAPGAVSVIVAIWAYSLDSCMDACASLNRRSSSFDEGSLRCRLVVFQRRMQALTSNGGNCFLKNATRRAGNSGTRNGNAITANLVAS